MSKSQRTKGAAYEREVANRLADLLGKVVKRNIGQARDGGDDITVKKALGGNFRVECKRRSRIGNLYDWMEQCSDSCETGDTPVVVCRGDGKVSLAVVRLDDLVALIRGEC